MSSHERGLTEAELAEITDATVRSALDQAKAAGIKTTTTVRTIDGGGSVMHIRSEFGKLPNGGSTTSIK